MKKMIIRAILGIMLIFAINSFLIEQGISIQVGLNLISLVTSGILGVPGVALLYAVAAIPIL